jgi:hypothetical protein
MMNWKIITTIQASKFEKPFVKEIAQFETFTNAEDFLKLVIPEETRERFRIEHI